MSDAQTGLRGKIEHELNEMMMGAENYFGAPNPKRRGHIACAADRIMAQIAEAIDPLEKKVYVPGQWRCPKCEFRLTQSNLYAATGTVGPRDQPGDKCPNCDTPLWRVSAMDDRNEAYKCANDTFDRVEALKKALQWIADQVDNEDADLDDIILCANRALKSDVPA